MPQKVAWTKWGILAAIVTVAVAAVVSASNLAGVSSKDRSVVEGFVKVQQTGNALANVKVVLDNSLTRLTNESGGFSFDSVLEEDHKIQVVSDDNHVLYTRAFVVPAGSQPKDLGIIYLDREPSSVEIVDEPIVWEPSGIQISDDTFWPVDIAIDDFGSAYVLDGRNNKIIKFSKDLRYNGTWGSKCWLYVLDNAEPGLPSSECDGKFWGPNNIAVDSAGYVYVADTGNDRIQKFTSNGDLVAKWFYSDRNRMTNYPSSFERQDSYIDVDREGNIYVVLWHRYIIGQPHVLKFDPAGNLLAQWGGYCDYVLAEGREGACEDPDGITGPLNRGDGHLDSPQGIAVDPIGYVYVADDFYGIVKFTLNGDFVARWEAPCYFGYRDEEGFHYDEDDDDINEFVYEPSVDCIDPDGDGPLELGDGQFSDPDRIAVDSSGYVYVADIKNDNDGIIRIQKFTGDGNFISKWKLDLTKFDCKYSSYFGWSCIGHLFAGSLGNVYVPISDGNKILILSPDQS